MSPENRPLIEALHQASCKCVLALTGGGTSAAAQLLAVPGGSKTVLEVIVPYGSAALVDFLGKQPEHFCSAATSRDMARRAYERGCWLAPGETVVGLGCTASLASDRPKRGEHRFHLAWQRADSIGACSLTLTKGARDREGEEQLLTAAILNALARAFQLDKQLTLPLLPGENLESKDEPLSGPARFFAGQEQAVWVSPDGRWMVPGADHCPLATGHFALLPGSFNPVHDGHWKLAAAARRILDMPVAFELSIANADKPDCKAEEVRRRLEPFTWRATVAITRARIFLEKARMFPGCVFVVGFDTAARIVASRYYESEAAMIQALREIRDRGCRFLVAARADAAGKLLEVENLELPGEFRDLFTGIPASEFRVDISSTELRHAEKTGS
jgi:hypothetical protein